MEGIERYLERFLFRIPGSVTPQPESDLVNRIMDSTVIEDKSGRKFMIAFHIFIDPFQRIRVDQYIDPWNDIVAVKLPGLWKKRLGP